MTARSKRRTVLHALTTAAVIAAAAALWHNLPAPSEVYRPFDVRGGVGEQVSGRLFDVTVTGIRVGQQVQAPRRPVITALGRWILVDAELLATRQEVLPSVELLVGPAAYLPSDRFQFVQLGKALSPLITQHGSWAFDVDPELLNPSTHMALRVWSGDSRLDSRLVVDIPFADAVLEADPLILPPTRESA
ncbi:hypothetical protein CRI77_24010 [Mycolicibacterium duvalii]|uniref:Uncharacterized protein n=1 Tax=Mycolicibacterium duvalii TaxID=39688 RepID=A0A7I7JXL5_9MYCO|nr:hypothetical protein [Mycolicibacterium duvalii]MCV7366942.1 hypothetical protein [Mycolicibacterium duvalii]PEG35982.1 hypothetical protein CRI77_24010 [Mycolicibacterium duvalii]BBX16595.1 hypothetical protein MDUV_14550 [Mycolicibacterium duvalii]